MSPPLATARATAPPTSLGGLLPFLKPYRMRIGVALFFLLATAAATLAFPLALRSLIDGGIAAVGSGDHAAAVQGHFVNLFLLATALGVLSAGRFYMVSWLGERVTADIRNAVYHLSLIHI